MEHEQGKMQGYLLEVQQIQELCVAWRWAGGSFSYLFLFWFSWAVFLSETRPGASLLPLGMVLLGVLGKMELTN